jgi:hypothetical protein
MDLTLWQFAPWRNLKKGVVCFRDSPRALRVSGRNWLGRRCERRRSRFESGDRL